MAKHHKWFHVHKFIHNWRLIFTEEAFAIVLALVIFIAPASAATRFLNRSLLVTDTTPGATTSYKVSFEYATSSAVGSIDLQFCINPIPYMPCVVPAGLDVSGAVLSSQAGETGYSILSKTTNHIVLTRPPTVVTTLGTLSSYTLSGIKNPTNTDQSFSIRLRSHATTDATGPQIDFGSVKSQVTQGVTLETQVPPMLVFCIAEEVYDNCVGTNENFYTDMGQLDPTETLIARSQMAVGTNASGGFAITANGTPLAAGTNVISSPSVPTESRPGTNQFGINLVENTVPAVGANPEGTWANATAAVGYDTPNQYKYVSGDVIASSPNVSLMKKFTVSFILNSSPSLRAGVYTPTITYIASGRF